MAIDGELACLGSQRCADHCIPWTAVCRDTLAEYVGLTPPPITGPTGTATNVPAGSVLLSLPRPVGPGRPTMGPGAPAFCYDGAVTDRATVQLACVPYYNLGAGATTAPGMPLLADCPQHRRCGGECIDETEVCLGVGERDSDRLTPFEH